MGFKALIVDDEALVRSVLINHLPWSNLGAEAVYEAADGSLGLEVALGKQVNLIISDIKMPRMNGLEFARRVREILPDCAFIFLTAYADKQFMKEAIKIKVDRFVEKPIDPEEITQVIREIIADGVLDVREAFFGEPVNKKIYRFAPEQLTNFTNAVRQKDRDAGFEILSRMADKMASCTATEPNYIRHVFSQLLGVMLGAKRDHGLDDIYRETEALCCSLSRFQSLNEIKNEVLRVVSLYFDAPETPETDPLQLMNSYMAQHALEASFSVAKMADVLCFTSTYLSAVYKKRTGKTINKKITELRMRKAKELLVSTNIKLYEIGRLVGYNDGKYFARVFTKEIGVNPKQYREMQSGDA